MDEQTIKNIMAFMNRGKLKGSEVPTYLRCMQELEKLLYDEVDETEAAKMAAAVAEGP